MPLTRWYKRKPIRTGAIVIGIIAFAYVYSHFNPSNYWFPRCPFLVLTGYKCPGCGSQRAIHALFHMDIASAFSLNAMLVTLIPVVIVFTLVELLRKKYPDLYSSMHHPAIIWFLFGLIVGWGVLRNLLGL